VTNNFILSLYVPGQLGVGGTVAIVILSLTLVAAIAIVVVIVYYYKNKGSPEKGTTINVCWIELLL
jgi:hypothetical protein